jgi:hypothetical protein
MSADEELKRSMKKYEEKAKELLAKKILKMSEEEFLPSGLKTRIQILKIICTISLFLCGPIMGWLYTEMAKGVLSINLFIVYLFPMSFLGIITAIALIIKTPTD